MTADLSSILPATDHGVRDTHAASVGGGNPSLTVVPGPAQGGCDPHHAAVGVGDDTLARRAEQIVRVRYWAEQVDDIEKARIATANRFRALTDPRGKGTAKGIPSWQPELVAHKKMIEQLQAVEVNARKELENAVKGHFLAGWIASPDAKGVGWEQTGRLLGVIQDPALRIVAVDGTAQFVPRTLSQLRAYCGFHVENGRAPARRKGVKPERQWSDVARMRVWLIAKQCGMIGGVRKTDLTDDSDGYDYVNRVAISKYGQQYLDGRVKYADAVHRGPCVRCGPKGAPAPAGSDLSANHKSARALRLVAKAVLRDLWREAHRTLTED